MEMVSNHLQIETSKLQLYKDDAFKQKLFATSSASIDKCGITDGICLFVANPAAKLEVSKPKPKGSLST